ncbi:GntR family transcriptional regulator [Leucobacter aridicollis]|uniref:DNA-binding GntR family transcriptional regulator n=1 Tax=Leucobacter aridicollis TaxID=283878 RepID=A0A852QYI4_9MICO|nr:GntR family transcriptional regulator [Leucobacter aridicollis]MBL3683486.1 GntR family transcriptional regulator [Leucobacter aridicollis]NYD25207.1 DNA-binding GntR family transcriptional regulator [Leucobacter aridicollis]
MAAHRDSVAQRPLLRQHVYDRLLEKLIDGTLAPGMRLRDDELAGMMSVSRTPVREAIAQLSAAGLVETAPNRYTRVTELFSPELPTILDTFEALCALAIANAAPALRSVRGIDAEVMLFRIERELTENPFEAMIMIGRFCGRYVTSPTLVQLIEVAQPRLLRIAAQRPEVLRAREVLSAAERALEALRRCDPVTLGDEFSKGFAAIREGIIGLAEGAWLNAQSSI